MNIIISAKIGEKKGEESPLVDFTFPSFQMESEDPATNEEEPPDANSKDTDWMGDDDAPASGKPSLKRYRWKMIWKNVFLMTVLHTTSVYAIFWLPHCNKFTMIFTIVCLVASALGVTAGAHRLWTHRSYKAKTPLRILLMFFNSLALQNSIFDWSRDHRTHHKYSETDADPHNACRGFFFSHIGWLLVKKHPDVTAKGRTISLDDLSNDPVVAFQKRYYVPLATTCCFILPTLIPWYFGGESLATAYFVTVLRYCVVLHATWCVNSVAHMYGNKPYDKQIHPSENHFVASIAFGEGFHNYHHTFPHDYSTSEFGYKLNPTTAFIDLMAFLGQAYDRRVITKGVIEARKRRTGEHSGMEEVRW